MFPKRISNYEINHFNKCYYFKIQYLLRVPPSFCRFIGVRVHAAIYKINREINVNCVDIKHTNFKRDRNFKHILAINVLYK